MSSIRAEMSGDTDELLQRLNRLSHLETRGVLNSIAEGLRTSTVERFTEEKTPEGTSWKPSIRAQLDAAKKEQSKQPPPREKTKELEV